jgi:small GTP-binding protein
MAVAVQAEPIAKETIRLLMLGDSGVGKSSLMIRFTNSTFSQQMMGTTGIDMRVKQMFIDNRWVRIQIWDTAGQERFHSISRTYYRGAHGIILTYDVGDRTSFINLPNWLEDIKKNTGFVHILLVGNKIDLQEVVTESEGRNLAQSNSIPFILTSAKIDQNVQDAFMNLIETILRSGIAQKTEKKTLKDRNHPNKKGCC